MKTFVFLSILAIAASVNGASIKSNLTSANVNLGQAIKNYYTSLKKVMPCGDAEIGLPILAPLNIEFVPLNYSDKYFSITGNFSNLYITGLDDFYFIRYDFNENTNIFNVDWMFPQLQVVGNADVGSFVSIGGYPLNLANDGLINMKLVDLRLVSSFHLANNAQGYMQESGVKFNFYLGDVAINNWNDLWDISGNNFFNKWLSSFILMYTEQIQVQINEIYRTIALPVINRSFEQMNQNEFIEVIVNITTKYNSVNC